MFGGATRTSDNATPCASSRSVLHTALSASASDLSSPGLFRVRSQSWQTISLYRHAPLLPSAAPADRPRQALHKSTPAFSPAIPVALLPYLAFVLLAATFTLAFYASTYVPSVSPYCTLQVIQPAPRAHSLPKEKIPARELAVASAASLLGGFGVVALFCSVGVYV